MADSARLNVGTQIQLPFARAVLRTILTALLGLLAGAVLGWSFGVFVLQLPWETTLLVIEVASVLGAVAGALAARTLAKRPVARS